MKTSIYAFLHEKWKEENPDDIEMVFFDDRHQAINDAFVNALGGDTLYDHEALESAYSKLMRKR